MAIALRLGFEKVKTENLRAPALKKGKKVQESGHVYNVEESSLKDGSFAIVKGEVMRQTSVFPPKIKKYSVMSQLIMSKNSTNFQD